VGVLRPRNEDLSVNLSELIEMLLLPEESRRQLPKEYSSVVSMLGGFDHVDAFHVFPSKFHALSFVAIVVEAR